MTVEQAIVALLYDHDTVIVPALGAFIRHDVSAQVNVITNEFQRPSSTLEFDPYQHEENPLISDFLMECDGITDGEARQQIAAFVAQCYNQMRDGETVALEGIGTLSLNSLQELAFESDATADFNADAFGLGDLEAQPVFDSGRRDDTKLETAYETEPLPDTFEEEREKEEAFDDGEDRGRHRFWWLWLLPVLLIGGAALWYFKFRPVEPEPPKPIAVVTADTLEIPEPIEIIVDTLALASDSTALVIDTLPTETVPEPLPTLEVITPEPESHSFIVGGCFSVEQNALNMATDAVMQGCPDAFVMKRGSQFLVCYGQFPTSDEAKTALPDIKANFNSKAWILNK